MKWIPGAFLLAPVLAAAQTPPVELEEVRIRAAEIALAADEARIDALTQVDLLSPVAEVAIARGAALLDRARELVETPMVEARLAEFAASEALLGVGLSSSPPEPWAAQDPADSLYRSAREALNRYEYRRAAQLFRSVRERFPRSEYAPEAAYWEAFSLYRVGTTEDLRAALRVLESQRESFRREQTRKDAQALTTRISGALARRGDAEAQRLVEQQARAGTASCDSEDMSVRVEALNALSQMDGDAAMPLLRRVLARQDECSASLRRGALMLVARNGGADRERMLLDVAQRDASASVRAAAVTHLASTQGEKGDVALESLLRSDQESMQRTAVRALARRESPRATRSLRSVLEGRDYSETVRLEALSAIGSKGTSTDDEAFLRGLFGRTDSERLREGILTAMSRSTSPETRSWMAGMARDQSQPVRLRMTLIARLGRSGDLSVADLSSMFDAASERRVREQIMQALNARPEPEATNKLMDIARQGTDPVLRRSAVNMLLRKNDPRIRALVAELVTQ